MSVLPLLDGINYPNKLAPRHRGNSGCPEPSCETSRRSAACLAGTDLKRQPWVLRYQVIYPSHVVPSRNTGAQQPSGARLRRLPHENQIRTRPVFFVEPTGNLRRRGTPLPETYSQASKRIRKPPGSAFLHQAVFSQTIQKRSNVLQSRLTVYLESLNERIRDSTDVMPRLQPLPDRRSRLVQRIVPPRLQIEQDAFLCVQHRERHVGSGAVVHAGNRFETLRFSGIDSGVNKGHAEARDKPFRAPMKRKTTHENNGPASRTGPPFSRSPIANKCIPYVFNHINGIAFLFLRIFVLPPLQSGSYPGKDRLKSGRPPETVSHSVSY